MKSADPKECVEAKLSYMRAIHMVLQKQHEAQKVQLQEVQSSSILIANTVKLVAV